MKLLYRGNSYESHSQVETVGTTIIAQYRGLSYQIQHPLFKDYTQPQRDFKYRGIPYTLNQDYALAQKGLFKNEQLTRCKPIT